eukprot:2383833-Prymnesium_polylepis.3
MSTAVGSSVEQGRSFIDECVKLDERMADLNALAVQLPGVYEALTGLEAALGLSDEGSVHMRAHCGASAAHRRVAR